MKTLMSVLIIVFALASGAGAESLKDQAFVDRLVADGQARIRSLSLETLALWLENTDETWRVPMTRMMNAGLNNSMLAGRPDPLLKALEPFDNRAAGLLILQMRERGVSLDVEVLFENGEFTLYLPADEAFRRETDVASRTGGDR